MHCSVIHLITFEVCKSLACLHEFWQRQQVLFDYQELIFDSKSSLTGTENRSFVDSSDIIDF